MGNSQPKAYHDKHLSTIVFDTRNTYVCCGGGMHTADEGFPEVCTVKEYQRIVRICYPHLGDTSLCQLGGHCWVCQYPVDTVLLNQLQDEFPHLTLFIDRIWVDVCVTIPHWEYVVYIRKGYNSDYYRHKMNLPPARKMKDEEVQLPPRFKYLDHNEKRQLQLEKTERELALESQYAQAEQAEMKEKLLENKQQVDEMVRRERERQQSQQGEEAAPLLQMTDEPMTAEETLDEPLLLKEELDSNGAVKSKEKSIDESLKDFFVGMTK